MNGPSSFDPGIARSFLYIQPGDPYSPRALEDAKTSIRQIPAVGGVRITEGTALDAYGRLPYQIDVEDRLPYGVGGSVQYSTTNGPTGQVYWEDRNVFGGAEQLRLQADVFSAPPWYITSESPQDFSIHNLGGRISASFLKPALWDTRNDLLIDALAERVSTAGAGFFGYEAEDIDATAALRHRFSQYFSFQAGLEGQTGSATDVLGKVDYTLVGVPLSVTYDDTDSKLDPTRGFRVTVSAAGFPTFLGSSLDLLQAKARASAYYALDADQRFVLAGRIGLGAMGGPALDEIPANWRFYAGGGGSVRGYAFDSLGPTGPFGAVIGGRSLFEASAELRVKVNDTIGIVPFFDAGNAFASSFPDFSQPLYTSAGLGLRYYTAVGPIRLDVAFPLQRHEGGGTGGGLCQHRAGFLMAPSLLRLASLALIAALIVFCAPARANEADKGVLANLISRALSSPTTSVSIGAVDGALSSDVSISDIVLSDRAGPWLKIDKVRLIWSRLALLNCRLEVDQLTIGHMQFLRRPLPSEAPPPSPDNATPQSILPELPVKVIVKQFAIQELSLDEPVIGVAARLNVSGKATLGPPSEGLDLTLASRRLDAPGEFKALMTYVPATDKLTFSVNSDEPAGGLFAHLVNLPGLPPATLAFNGAGPLDNFTAKLDFSAGPDVWAKGEVVVARQDAGRRLTLDLNSRLEGMTPPIIRPVFAGETTLKGDLYFNDDSSIATPGLHLVSANARLDIEGGRSADNVLGVKIHAGAIPGAQIGKLDLNASIAGPIASPTIEGAFDAGQIRVAEGSLGHAAATFHAAPNGPLTDEATRIGFEGQTAVSGLALADPALARAVGSEVRLSLRGSASLGGDIAFDTLELAASDLDARYSGLLAPKVVRGRLEVTADDLSRFGPLVGTALKGEARLTADLDGAPRYGALNATLDAHATKLVTDYPLLDKVTGGDLRLTGAARTTPGGGFGFTDLMATGAHGSARLNGSYASDKVDIDARIDLPQVQVVDPRVIGRAAVVAALTGTPVDLGANLKATLSEGRLLDRKTSGLTLEAEASHLTGLLEAQASLSGDIDGHPLEGSAHVARRADGGWALDNLGLGLASAHLDGAVTIGADQLADGALNFGATNLDDLSPLVLTKLSGAVQAKVEAASAAGKQALSIAATSDRMSVGGARLEGLKVDMTIDDLWTARGISGQARLARAEVGGQSLADVKLAATRPRRFERSRFHGLGARAGGEGARTAFRRAADPPRSREPHGGRRRAAPGARGSGDAHLWKRRARHPELRASRQLRPPFRLRARRTDARPSRDGGRAAARRRSTFFCPASASPASPTARRRSAERRTIPPATGACA